MTELYPAIDLRGGRVVRLIQGDYEQQTTYADDPVATAVSFVDAGATWIHVVDLDAARTGSPENRSVVAAIAHAVSGAARVQTGGGVRTVDDAEVLAEVGVTRVVMGSAAVRQPSLVEQASQCVEVAVGLDHRDGELSVNGWTQGSGVRLETALSWFPTASAFVVTDIGRDGMLLGPDIVGLTETAANAHVPVIASGGVATLDDVIALARIPGIGGVITGKAIYEHRFTVEEAVAALRATGTAVPS